MYQRVSHFLEKDANSTKYTIHELNDILFQLHIPALVFVVMCMVAGIFGNTLVIVIYKSRFRRSNHRYFILFLAVTDLLACVTGVPFLVASLRLPYLMTSAFVCKVLRYFHYFVNNSAGLLLVVIAVERFRKIVFPFKTQFSVRQTLIICYATVFVSALVAIPAPIYFDATDVATGVGNVTGKECFVKTKLKGGFEIFYFALMLETIVCIAVFAVLYSMIVKKLCTNDQFLKTVKSMNSISSARSTRNNERNSVDELSEMETPSQSEAADAVVAVKYERRTSAISKLAVGSSTATALAASTESIPHGRKNGTHSNGARALWRKSLDLLHAKSKEDLTKPSVSRAHSDVRLNRIRTANDNNIEKINKPLSPFTLVTSNRPTVKTSSSQSRKSSRTTVRVTIMLLTVSVAFAIAFLPHMALMLATVSDKGFLDRLDRAESMVYQLFLRIFILNNVINPFIYLACDTKFRTESKRLLCRCCKISK